MARARDLTITNATITTPDGTVYEAHRVVVRAGRLVVRHRRGREVWAGQVQDWERDRRKVHTFQTDQGAVTVRPTTCGTCGG